MSFFLGGFAGIFFQRQIGLGNFLQALGISMERPLGAHQQSRIELLRSLSLPQGAVVFLGDSLIDSHEWHEVFPDRRVVTRAISGGMCKDFVGLCDFEKAAAVFCLIGANDIGNHVAPEVFAANYRKMISQFPAHLKVHVMSIPPIRKHGGNMVESAAIVRFNEQLKVVATLGDYHYIDLHSAMPTEDDGLFAEDGLHLSPRGYALLVEQLRPSVQLALPAQAN